MLLYSYANQCRVCDLPKVALPLTDIARSRLGCLALRPGLLAPGALGSAYDSPVLVLSNWWYITFFCGSNLLVLL